MGLDPSPSIVYDSSMVNMNTSTSDRRSPLASNDTAQAESGLSGSIFKFQNHEKETGAKIWSMTFDLPGEKVNKFNEAVIAEMEALLPKLNAKAAEIESLVIFSGKKDIFIAGADIKMIQATSTAEEAETLAAHGQKLLLEWERLPFPTVVAINGAALGGGCEFSLACSAILMSESPKAKIGLPEIMLGVIPGMGGCVRMPRKIGLASALDAILSSKQLDGRRALGLGLADGLIPAESFETFALKWVSNNWKKIKSGQRVGKKPKLGGMGGIIGSVIESPVARSIIFNKAYEGVMSKTKGQYPAPLETLKVIQETFAGVGPKFKGKDAEWRYAREAKGFGKMAATSISKALISIFFLTEDVKKKTGLTGDRKVDFGDVHHVGVLGAGVMGGGIAQLCASKNYPVRMKDINDAGLEAGIQQANKILKTKKKRRRINDRQYLQQLTKVLPVLGFDGFKNTDLVIEAIVENMDLKKKVLADLENHISDDCFVVSNTSSLSISEMQNALKHPERFCGMHFFNPVHKMPLIEVIRGEKSSDEVVAAVFDISKKLGKFPIVVKDAPGFLVNRLLAPYLNEATYLVVDGAPIDQVDRALLAFGMPMGPIELIDEVGVDVGEKVIKILHAGFGERMAPAPGNAPILEAKRLGKKNGKGFYVYEGPKQTKRLDPKVYGLMNVKPQPGKFTDEEIVDRCILPMINEAARCLEEKIVESASEVDLGMIMGTGFSPWRGGLLRYADSLGLNEAIKRLQIYESKVSKRFTPSSALRDRATNEGRFYVE